MLHFSPVYIFHFHFHWLHFTEYWKTEFATLTSTHFCPCELFPSFYKRLNMWLVTWSRKREKNLQTEKGKEPIKRIENKKREVKRGKDTESYMRTFLLFMTSNHYFFLYKSDIYRERWSPGSYRRKNCILLKSYNGSLNSF